MQRRVLLFALRKNIKNYSLKVIMELTITKRYINWFGIHGAIFFAILYFFSNNQLYLSIILFSLVFFGFAKDIYDAWLVYKKKDSLWHPYFEHMPLSVLIFSYTAVAWLVEQRPELLIICVLAGADAFVDFQDDKKCCKI